MGRRRKLKTWSNTKVEEPKFELLRATIPVYSSKIAAKIAQFLANEFEMTQVSWWGKDVLIRGEMLSDTVLARTKKAVVTLNRLYTTLREEKGSTQ